jgi:hypothetical protein
MFIHNTKIPIMFMCMKIVQYFCDVLVSNYKIIILHFHITHLTIPHVIFYFKNCQKNLKGIIF